MTSARWRLSTAAGSASPWHAGGWVLGTAVVLALAAVLVLVLVLVRAARGGGSGSGAVEAEAEPPVTGWQLAVLGFSHPTEAEDAFAAVREQVWGTPPWLHDVAFAHSGRHGRMLLRGTFAGRYVHVDDLRSVPAESPILAALREGVPEGGSALVSFAPSEQVATLVDTFRARAACVERRTASVDEVATLATAVSGARATAPPPAP